jgi:lipid II:glycine glycyltransferase (peptidoglycan interpeptide bridge formation enzyme)
VIQKIDDIELLKQFNRSYDVNTFTQSYEYFKYLESSGVVVGLVGEIKNKNLISACVYSIINAKRGRALQVIHGPVIPDQNAITLRQYLDYLKNIAKQNKCDFIRINPITTSEDNTELGFKTNGYQRTPFENMFGITNIVNLSGKNAKSLLAGFSKTYQAKVNGLLELEKKGEILVTFENLLGEDCRKLTENSDVEESEFDSIMKISNYFGSKNHGFVTRLYYKKQLSAYQTYVINADYLCNHHGAQQLGELDFNILIHYKTMLRCIELGISKYDFWGLCEKTDTKHPWFKSSSAKRHFGGEDMLYLSGQDLALTPKYWLTNLYEKYQKIKRGH